MSTNHLEQFASTSPLPQSFFPSQTNLSAMHFWDLLHLNMLLVEYSVEFRKQSSSSEVFPQLFCPSQTQAQHINFLVPLQINSLPTSHSFHPLYPKTGHYFHRRDFLKFICHFENKSFKRGHYPLLCSGMAANKAYMILYIVLKHSQQWHVFWYNSR